MKRLYRIEQGKMVAGVCGGLAEYFNIDPSLMRIGWVLILCSSCGTGLIAYLVAAAILPSKDSIGPQP